MKNMGFNSDQVFIPANRTKLLLIGIFSIVLALLLICIWYIPAKFNIDPSVELKMVSVCLSLLSLVGGAFSIVKIFDRSAGLLISKEGIDDSSSGVSLGFISWDNIREIELVSFRKQKLIVIRVVNPEVYLAKATALKRMFLRKIYEQFGAPIVIAPNSLKCKLDELLEKLGSHYPDKLKIIVRT